MPEKDGKTNAPATAYKPAEEGHEGGEEQHTPAPPPPTPADPVGDAKRALEQAKNALADAEDTAKRDGEIEKAIAQYRGEQLQLEAREGGLKVQLQEGFEDLKPTDPEKAWVKQIRGDLKGQEKTLADSVAKQSGDLKNARDALDAAKKDLSEAKARFESLRVLGKGIQAKHNDADALSKEAYDAIARQKRCLAYYLLHYRLDEAIDRPPTPIEVADFVDAINSESNKVGKLNAAQRDLDAEIKERETKLADDEKKLADLRKNFEATIRDKLATRA